MNPLWTGKELSEILGSECPETLAIQRVITDSRDLQEGDLYVPLRGERFDGHDFIQDAFEKGAVACLSEKGGDFPIISVANTLEALQKLGAAARERTKARVLAITGSAGKTTAKEALNFLLGKQRKTWATPKSYNNHLGVPISLANLSQDTKYGVFEVGMNNPGELQVLSKQVRPDVAMITTVLPVHLSQFESIEGIVRAKAEVFQGLKSDGIALINRNLEHFELLKELAKPHEVYTFGGHPKADYRLLGVSSQGDMQVVKVDIQGRTYNYTLNFSGDHWPLQSLAWLAAVDLLGGDVKRAVDDISQFQLLPGRGELLKVPHHTGGKFYILDESYNANPEAMRLALQRLSAFDHGKRRIAVLGDMAEIGATEESEHLKLASLIQDLKNIDIVYGLGPLTHKMIQTLPESQQGQSFTDPEELAKAVAEQARPDDVYLVKGSRGGGVLAKMAYTVNSLKNLEQHLQE